MLLDPGRQNVTKPFGLQFADILTLGLSQAAGILPGIISPPQGQLTISRRTVALVRNRICYLNEAGQVEETVQGPGRKSRPFYFVTVFYHSVTRRNSRGASDRRAFILGTLFARQRAA